MLTTERADVSNRVEIDHISYLQANSLTRLMAAVVGMSLIAASGVLIVEAQSQSKPLFQLPATIVTIGLGALVLYAGSAAVKGRRALALAYWTGSLLLLVMLPLLQVLPIEYNTLALLDFQALAPPLWQYTVAIPLLLFLVLNTAIPSMRPNSTSNVFLLVGLTSTILFLFFTTALLGDMANRTIMIYIPLQLFVSVAAPIGISALMVMGVVLIRKGLVALGIATLLATGLGIEWISTWSYDGPHFIEAAKTVPVARYPLLPVLAGTIPGMLAGIAAVLAGWESYIKSDAASNAEPVLGSTL